MSIKGLMLDPVSNSPIVVLKDDDEKFFLPIWVGIFEANAIALQLENITTPRPMTHDLLRNMIAELNARVTRIVINDLRDSTFFAQIRLLIRTPAATAPSRSTPAPATPSPWPSAPRRRSTSPSPSSTRPRPSRPDGEDQDEKMKKWFENLSPEDLGKYKM